MDQIAEKRSRMFYSILILFSCFLVLAIPMITHAAAVQGKVTSIKEDMIELSVGSDKGLKEGDRGRIYYTVKVSGEPQPQPVYVARFKVTYVSKQSSMARIEDKTNVEIKVGFLVEVNVSAAKKKPPPQKVVEKERGYYPNIKQLVVTIKPLVVKINITKRVQSPMDDFFRGSNLSVDEFFQKFLGGGSGFIIDKAGYILTNYHIIKIAEELKVTFSDKKKVDAQIIGTDPKRDLALIKIKADSDLPVCRFGDSDRLEIGEFVIGIGNPSGAEHTVTTMVISAKGKMIGVGPFDDFLQFDTYIDPANIGGPLLNLNGEVVGIITVVAKDQGKTFAIPINMAKKLLPQLKKGRVVYGYLGVYIQDLNPELVRTFGLKEAQGVLISDVIPDSPAEKGKIQKGDVVLEYDGQQVKDRYQFTKMVGNTTVGKMVNIVVWRNKERKTLPIIIGEVPEKQVAAAPTKPEETGRWGLKVQDISPSMADQLGLPDDTGVVVTEVEPNSPAQKEGLQVGDVIIEVEHNQIKNLADFRKYMENYKERKTLLLTIRIKANNYRALFVILKKGE